MKDSQKLRRVSDVEPTFTEVDGRPICTRTWTIDADPALTTGEIVDVGGTFCRVVDKVTGASVVTYKFSPIDRHADLAAWAREPDLPQGKYLGNTEEGEQFHLVVARCHCGWFEYFPSFSDSPSACPRCSSNLVIRNQSDQDEIVSPVVTIN